jgi:ATP-dependent helicase/nuclease subunit A
VGVALPLWRAATGERDAVSEAICARDAVAEREERQRLLYVALTRARDRLYVTGWLTRGGSKEGGGDGDEPGGGGEPCWHELLRRAVLPLAGTAAVELPSALGLPGEALRFERGVATAAPAAEESRAETEPELPAWIGRAAPAEPSASPLAPSRAGRDEGAVPATGPRFRRGLLVHRLLQFLPDLTPGERPGAAERLLAAAAPDLGPAERAEVAAGVLGLLQRPEFAPVFAAGSRAEQPICGTVGGRAIVGQIDRLVVTPDEVLVVELKSGRFPPAHVAATPAAALGQLAAYRALLARIYPGRRIRAGLLWTELPRLDEVPGALLDRHAPDAA